MIFCCEEHVELALDEAVDELETAPILEKVESGEKSGLTCGYCGKPATYMVGNE